MSPPEAPHARCRRRAKTREELHSGTAQGLAIAAGIRVRLFFLLNLPSEEAHVAKHKKIERKRELDRRRQRRKKRLKQRAKEAAAEGQKRR
jgi:glycerol kinase